MLKREREALDELYISVADLDEKIKDKNTKLDGEVMDDFFKKNNHVIEMLLVRLVDQSNLKLWHKIAFAIVIQFIRRLRN